MPCLKCGRFKIVFLPGVYTINHYIISHLLQVTSSLPFPHHCYSCFSPSAIGSPPSLTDLTFRPNPRMERFKKNFLPSSRHCVALPRAHGWTQHRNISPSYSHCSKHVSPIDFMIHFTPPHTLTRPSSYHFYNTDTAYCKHDLHR